MKTQANKLHHIKTFLLMACLTGIIACNDQPKQQTSEVHLDTTVKAAQDDMIIDTTASISYGIVEENPTGKSPDLDTLEHVDLGAKPENAFEE